MHAHNKFFSSSVNTYFECFTYKTNTIICTRLDAQRLERFLSRPWEKSESPVRHICILQVGQYFNSLEGQKTSKKLLKFDLLIFLFYKTTGCEVTRFLTQNLYHSSLNWKVCRFRKFGGQIEFYTSSRRDEAEECIGNAFIKKRHLKKKQYKVDVRQENKLIYLIFMSQNYFPWGWKGPVGHICNITSWTIGGATTVHRKCKKIMGVGGHCNKIKLMENLFFLKMYMNRPIG